MLFSNKNLLLATKIYNNTSKRNFWAWLNIIFNRIDDGRIKEVGPDRACAEWLLRNGAIVTFEGEEPTKDYNIIAKLPVEIKKQLVQVDASEASISYHGKLTTLTLYDLSVKDWANCKAELKKSNPSCNLNLSKTV